MSAAGWLAVGLALAFAGAGAANLAGAGTIREDFWRWGYPAGFHRVTGAIEIIGAALLLPEATRDAGLLLLGFTMVAALATLLRHRAGLRHIAPAAALGLGLLILFLIG